MMDYNYMMGGGGKARAGKNSFPSNPFPFCPPERLGFRIRSPDFRQKKFGF